MLLYDHQCTYIEPLNAHSHLRAPGICGRERVASQSDISWGRRGNGQRQQQMKQQRRQRRRRDDDDKPIWPCFGGARQRFAF